MSVGGMSSSSTDAVKHRELDIVVIDDDGDSNE
jgi:hypothetical protein